VVVGHRAPAVASTAPAGLKLEARSGIEQRFHIRGVIGTGSFGVVYEAFDAQRNRTVALKTLARADADSIARFKREFRSLAELRHPNLASLYELLHVGEQWALSMELVHGKDLLEHLSFSELQSAFLDPAPNVPFDPDARISFRRKPAREGKLSAVYLQHVRDSFRQLAEAIAFLHAQGVVHRDVKPSNVMITPEGRVVLLDFGLAIDGSADASLEEGLVVGTPGYMSPEQIAMAPPAPPSDWYAFGVILYQAITGHRPFVGTSPAELLDQQMRATPLPASTMLPGIPADLASLADRCMEREPSLRPLAGEILEAFGSSLVRARGDVRDHERPKELIGRGREVRTLVRHVTALAAEGSGVVLLHGSPGVGKSVLADQVLDEVRYSTDALILGGRCRGWESLPFNAIDAVVDSIARIARTDRSEAVDEVLGRSVAMTHLFPTLAFPSMASVDETVSLPPTPALATARASAELHALLVAMAGGRPVVLFLDDAHWGDYQSAEVFTRVLTLGAPLRVVLVLAYRTEDWRTSLLLQSIVNGPIPHRELELTPLSASLMEKLVRRDVPDASKAFRRTAMQHAAGNPGLLDKILRHAERDVSAEPSLREAIDTRVDELSTSSRRIFDLLLQAEGPLPEELIERSLELFESDEPLRALTRAQLIRLRRTGHLLELDLYHPRMRELMRER
jgi:serine/threonine protein kinase